MEQRLRLAVYVHADPDLYDSDLPENAGFVTVAELTNEIERLIDEYPNVERQSECLFERLDRGSKEADVEVA